MGHWAGVGWVVIFAVLTAVGLLLLAVLAVRLVGGGVAPPAPADPRSPVPGATDTAGVTTSPTSTTPPTAHQILSERFARGEIDAEELRDRLRRLERGP